MFHGLDNPAGIFWIESKSKQQQQGLRVRFRIWQAARRCRGRRRVFCE
jgi:hypothetical protein